MGKDEAWKEYYKTEILNILSAFPTITAAKGADYFRQGRVKLLNIKHDQNGLHCEADVEGGRSYEVDLSILKSAELDAYCSCPVTQGFCKHIYSVLRSCYGFLDKPEDENKNIKQDTVLDKISKLSQKIENYLATFIKPPLTAKIKNRALVIVECFLELQNGNPLNYGDLSQMGLKHDEYQWQEIDLWDEVGIPNDILDFWLILASYTRYSDGKITPELDLPYDLSRIDDQKAKIQAITSEKKFKEFYSQLTYNIPSKNLLNLRTTADLYLRIHKTSAELEGVFSVAPSYKQIKPEELEYLIQGMTHDMIVLEPGSKCLIENLSTIEYHKTVSLNLTSPGDVQVLRNILLNPDARNKVINKDGMAFQWEEESLQWILEKEKKSPSEEDDQYSISLAWDDRKELPKWTRCLVGKPTLYLSDKLIAPGPHPAEEMLNINGKAVLPAQWLEREEFKKALRQFGVVLPEELRGEDTNNISIRPILNFKAWLKGTVGGDETCRIRVTAVTQDGESPILEYGINGWEIAADFTPESVGLASEDQISSLSDWIDESSIRQMPSLMRFLDPHFSDEDGWFESTITKRFPDEFHQWLSDLPSDAILELDPILSDLQRGNINGKASLDVIENPTTNDWFDVDIALDTGDVELTPEEKALLLKSPGNWVRLKSGSWKRINFSFNEADNKDLARLGFSPNELARGKQKVHVVQLANETGEKWIAADKFSQITKQASELKLEVAPKIPSTVTGKLRPYQVDGFHFLSYLSRNNFGGILADDMGLGKTLQTLTWLNHLNESEKVVSGPVLVVCPKSVMDNWANEVELFTKTTPVYVWDASSIGNFAVSESAFEIHVVNYAQMRNKSSQISKIHWLAIVLDEAQNIKNPNSQSWRTATSLKSSYRIALTGTPIENRLMDLWSILEFSMPGILGSRASFKENFNPKTDSLAQLRLTNRIRPFILRRTKDQVAQDLPERVEEDIMCSMSGEQDIMYRAELKRAQQVMLKIKTDAELSKMRFNVLTSLLRLRQICCHPKLYTKDSSGKSAKLEVLEDRVEAILDQGSKVLIFSQFVEMLGLIKGVGRKFDWKMWELTGKTEKRGQIVRDFQEHEGPGVFLISLKAGGAGLNLTAAQYVILFDPWWNPAVENQAIDRTHRIGQKNKVVAYRFLAKDSIEQKIRRLQIEKNKLASEVLDETKFSESLTMDDFKYIFSNED